MPAFYKEWAYKAKLSRMAKVITRPQPRAVVFTGQDSALARLGEYGLQTHVYDGVLPDLALKEGSAYPTPRFFERDECSNLISGLHSV